MYFDIKRIGIFLSWKNLSKMFTHGFDYENLFVQKLMHNFQWRYFFKSGLQIFMIKNDHIFHINA